MRKVGTKDVLAAIKKLEGFDDAVDIKNSACVFERRKMFIQGLLVERTPYRHAFYIWEFIYPLFHPNANLALNFSRRIGQGGMFEGSAEDISGQVASCIREDGVLRDRLFRPISNKDFLAIQPLVFRHPENFPATVVFDVATAMVLENMTDHASKLLQHIWEKRSVCAETGLLHLLVKHLLDNMGNETIARGVVDILAECNREHMLAR